MILTATCCRPLFQFAVMPFSPKRTETTFFRTKLITASIHSASEQCRFIFKRSAWLQPTRLVHARTAVNGIFFCKHAAILLPELTPSYLRPNSLCTLRTRVQLQGGKCDGRVFVNKCNGHSIYWTQSLVLLCPSCQRMYIEVKFTAGGKFRYRLLHYTQCAIAAIFQVRCFGSLI